ncbi:MAG: hypothetical protein ACLGPL_03645, partial [Acidobacteriota bacterium]
GTIVEINDPVGRYGWTHSPDQRWSADTSNPTVTTANGYPMCLPKSDPTVQLDLDCPGYNRPLNPGPANILHDPFLQNFAPRLTFVMPAKRQPNGAGVTTPDPWKAVPLKVGDYITFSGVLCKLTPSSPFIPYDPTIPVGAGNLPLNRQTYISANTVRATQVAVYSASGNAATVGPAYVQLFTTRIGNGGADVAVPPKPGLGILGGVIPAGAEAKTNIVIRGWCTDSTQLVDIYAVDVNAAGVATDRLLGTVLPDAGLPGGKGVRGRFRFEVGKGNFLPTTRSYKAVSRHGQVTLPNKSGLNGAVLAGLSTGTYTAPNFTYEFNEAPPGFPAIPLNFNDMPFLRDGEGGNPSFGPLLPFPPVAP